MTPVVVSTSPGRAHWVADCLASIDREVLVVSSRSWILGCIRWVYDHTDLDRWLLLQDSVVVHDQSLFDLIDEQDRPVSLYPRPTMYMATYDRAVLEKLNYWPTVSSKADCVKYENVWMDAYARACGGLPVLFPDLGMFPGFPKGLPHEVRHGRENVIRGNSYLSKYQGCWNPRMIPQATSGHAD